MHAASSADSPEVFGDGFLEAPATGRDPLPPRLSLPLRTAVAPVVRALGGGHEHASGHDVADLGYRDWPLAVPVVVRPGPVWSSSDETEAFLGLRYGSNWVDVRQGDVLTVTARGWYSFLDELWGTTPKAMWALIQPARR